MIACMCSATGADNNTHHNLMRGRLLGNRVSKNKINHSRGKPKKTTGVTIKSVLL